MGSPACCHGLRYLFRCMPVLQPVMHLYCTCLLTVLGCILPRSLDRELERNLALRVEPGDTADAFVVSGRGALHLGKWRWAEAGHSGTAGTQPCLWYNSFQETSDRLSSG